MGSFRFSSRVSKNIQIFRHGYISCSKLMRLLGQHCRRSNFPFSARTRFAISVNSCTTCPNFFHLITGIIKFEMIIIFGKHVHRGIFSTADFSLLQDSACLLLRNLFRRYIRKRNWLVSLVSRSLPAAPIQLRPRNGRHGIRLFRKRCSGHSRRACSSPTPSDHAKAASSQIAPLRSESSRSYAAIKAVATSAALQHTSRLRVVTRNRHIYRYHAPRLRVVMD